MIKKKSNMANVIAATILVLGALGAIALVVILVRG